MKKRYTYTLDEKIVSAMKQYIAETKPEYPSQTNFIERAIVKLLIDDKNIRQSF